MIQKKNHNIFQDFSSDVNPVLKNMIGFHETEIMKNLFSGTKNGENVG